MQQSKKARPKGNKSSRKGKEKATESTEGESTTTRKRRKPSSRQTSATKNGAASESEGATDSERVQRQAKRKKKSASPSRSRRSREKSLSAFDMPIDVNAEPGEDLDPTATTMAAICVDTGQGRVSSKLQAIRDNHLAWKAANKAKRARMRALMESKKYGKTQEEAEAEVDAAEENAGQSEQQENTGGTPSAAAGTTESNSGFDYGEAASANRFNVQIRIGPNGETIVDEESLYVDRAENAEYSTEQYTLVEESDQTKFTNSLSYSKKSRGSRWSADETELFYEVSNLINTDMRLTHCAFGRHYSSSEKTTNSFLTCYQAGTGRLALTSSKRKIREIPHESTSV
jgi:transcription factor TFIIIB component B''